MKKALSPISRSALLIALSTVPVACMNVSNGTSEEQLRAAADVANASRPADEGYYQSAVTAITNRDYALALDYLQAARDEQPGDVRVLNAFGVVYDKLGRFDLSARYYAQAGALEPGSQIVANNVAYSRMLQGMKDPQQVPSQVASAPSNVPQTTEPSLPAPSVPDTASARPLLAELTDVTPPSTPMPSLDTSHLTISTPVTSFAMASSASLVLPETVAPMHASPQAIDTTQPTFSSPVASLVDALSVSMPRMESAQIEPQIAAMPAELPGDAAPTTSSSEPNPFNTAIRVPTALTQFAVSDPHSAPSLRPAANEPALRSLANGQRHAAVSLTPARQPARPFKPVRLASHGATPLAYVSLAALRLAVSPLTPVVSTPAHPAAKLVLTTGHPLHIVNASGRKNATDPVRKGLSALRWAVPYSSSEAAAAQPVTTVRYPRSSIIVAQGLAHTLPFPVRLTPNTCDCGAIELIVGADFLGWNNAGRRLPDVWRKSLKMAALPDAPRKGVR
jgi:LytR cell envelope-related transcriptional attenuator